MVVHLKHKITLAARIIEVTDEFWDAETTMANIQEKICFLLRI